MIAGSLSLIAAAAVLLVTGVWQSSSGLLAGSIGASLLAALWLVVGIRRRARLPAPAAASGTGERAEEHGEYPAADGGEAGHPTSGAPTIAIPLQAEREPARAEREPAQAEREPARAAAAESTPEEPATDDAHDPLDDEADPPDEPAPQEVSAADAARVARMLTEVLVVDGRPRYHLPGCVHLLGREMEPLPVSEALELGFSPCSLCEPDSALLADARRV